VPTTDLIADLQARGLVAQMAGDNELKEHLASGSRAIYCGFDPTADSLHLGHLVPLLILRRCQLAGHRPIALVGGATGLIGDPSFKAEERKLNSQDTVLAWVNRLQGQISRFLDFKGELNPATMVNNLDWIGGISTLDFLRDVGKHFSINQMIKKESVQQRIDRDSTGISFTEFTYMLLQSYDFAELNKRHDCTVQIGGSDQWGNITEGISLTRRMNNQQVFGFTVPLITKSDGTKFGKTESGAIWLDPKKTSPYAFYQFWLNTADNDAGRFLRYFTFLDNKTINEIDSAIAENGPGREAQKVLANEVTQLVHGDEGLAAAQRISNALFNGSLDTLSLADWQQLKMDGIPHKILSRGALGDQSLPQILSESGMVNSGKQVKDALSRNAIQVNGIALPDNLDVSAIDSFAPEAAIFEHFYLVKLGKRKYQLFEIV